MSQQVVRQLYCHVGFSFDCFVNSDYNIKVDHMWLVYPHIRSKQLIDASPYRREDKVNCPTRSERRYFILQTNMRIAIGKVIPSLVLPRGLTPIVSKSPEDFDHSSNNS